MEKWYVSAKRAEFDRIAEQFEIDRVTARIIRNREVIGETAIEEYLHGTLADLADARALKDIELAVAILKEKIKKQKKIRIIGDYDIDGIQSVYILYTALRECGAVADYAIPDRIADGYGINARLIEKAFAEGADTILTCDNGIAAADVVALAKEREMTVIITDHHEVPYETKETGERVYCIPKADAVVNPKQQDCPYPFKGLCGAAVAFKLVQVLYQELGLSQNAALKFIENAAFATVGDVMNLLGENRTLVKEGLKALNTTKNHGMRALAARNQIEMGSIRSYHIGFILGPCLNASGRLDTAKRALELMLAEDENSAAKLAGDLYDLNVSRKEMTEQGVILAKQQAQQKVLQGEKILVLYLPECHESLAGIIAGRIREQFYRPVFVLTRSEEEVKGSGRSIESYSMYEEMTKCSEYFTKYGGHPMAAGLSMPEKQVEQFRRRINELTQLTQEDLIPKVTIDVPMPLDYITKELIEELKILEPFGKGNEKPVFADKQIHIISIGIFGKNKNVCRMQVKKQGSASLTAIYFGDTEAFLKFLEQKYGAKAIEKALQGKGEDIQVSLVYYPEINTYQGRETLQIIVRNYC